MSRKKLLANIVSLFFMTGLVLSCSPFVFSLFPSQKVKAESKYELDLSQHPIGTLKKYDLMGRSYYIYRRTKEQISWLETYAPTQTKKFVLENADGYGYDYKNKFRSQTKEFFIFKAWENGTAVSLQQDKGWYRCGQIFYHDGELKFEDGRIFKGAIICSKSKDNFLEYNYHVYDVAGISISEYVAPLMVPNYKINEKGNATIQLKP